VSGWKKLNKNKLVKKRGKPRQIELSKRPRRATRITASLIAQKFFNSLKRLDKNREIVKSVFYFAADVIVFPLNVLLKRFPRLKLFNINIFKVATISFKLHQI